MKVKKPLRNIWITVPSGAELDDLKAGWEAELSRTVTMPETVQRVLAERRDLLLRLSSAGLEVAP